MALDGFQDEEQPKKDVGVQPSARQAEAFPVAESELNCTEPPRLLPSPDAKLPFTAVEKQSD